MVWRRRAQGTPAEIVDKLNREINAALADPRLRRGLPTSAALSLAGSPADFGKFIADETEKWAQGDQVCGHQAGLTVRDIP